MGHYINVKTPIGTLTVVEKSGEIIKVSFDVKSISSDYENEQTSILNDAEKQINEYFKGVRRNFDLPIAPCGTSFQKSVWESLINIPYGSTRSYKDIAQEINSPKAFRAVGMANNKNPIVIIIPCHRVIGSDGSLTGYAAGIKRKEFLIDLESRHT